MNEVWNLNVIYEGFEDPQYEKDLTLLKEKAAAYAAATGCLAETDPLAGLRSCITLEEEVTRLANKLAEYAMLRQSADARDAQAGSQIGRIMAVISGLAAPQAAFKDWASKLPNLMELVAGDPDLKDYTFMFENMADSARYQLTGEAEAVMMVQKALADSIALLNEAAPSDKVLALKGLEAFGKAADGKATKIIIPSEIQGIAGLAASLKGIADGSAAVEKTAPAPAAGKSAPAQSRPGQQKLNVGNPTTIA